MTLRMNLGAAVLLAGILNCEAHALDSDPRFARIESPSIHIVNPSECKIDFPESIVSPAPAKQRNEMQFLDEDLKSRLESKNATIDTTSAESVDGIFSWAPRGTGSSAYPPGCDSDAIQQSILGASSHVDLSRRLKSLFAVCESTWSRNTEPGIQALFDLTQVRYNLCQNRNIRKIQLRLQDGSLLRGFIGIKPGWQARPLIIARCGLMCNADSSVNLITMMHLFDASPFNVVLLGSITGSDFVRDNQFVSIGGLDEGTQFLNVAQLLKTSRFGALISSYHLMSLSLGGHGVYYASIMNHFNRDMTTPHFSSALAVCPVVDLQQSTKTLMQDNFRGDLARRFLLTDVLKVITSVPHLSLFFKNKDDSMENLRESVVAAAVDHYLHKPLAWARPPYQTLRIRSASDLWAANRLQDQPFLAFSSPVLTLASRDDFFVLASENAEVLQKRADPNGPVQVMEVAYGNHCGIDLTYGWDVVDELYRDYFLQHSPELLRNRRAMRAPLAVRDFTGLNRIGLGKLYSRFVFRARANSDKLTLMYSVWERTAGPTCGEVWNATTSCVEQKIISIPLSSFPEEWASIPNTEAEAEALTRFANNNLKVVDLYGNPVVGTRNTPFALQWADYR